MKGELAQLSTDFAIRIVEYYKWLVYEKKEYVMSKQILRSGTSIGANVHESEFASSRPDFRSKLKIAAKEAGETEYWLIVLEKTGYFDPCFDDLKISVRSLVRMLSASLKKLSDVEDV